ncbi:MAG: hypothetical protein PHV74_03310 [Dehalococcoidia bacterium]|nr:hypothetical protein [Dehalococcoidia bacterium]
MSFLGSLTLRARKGFSKENTSDEVNLPKLASGKQIIQKKRVSSTSNQELLYFDLFYQLSYMAAISTAGISRDRIFDYSAQLSGKAAVYFKEIQRIAVHLGYDYADACRLEGESVDDEMVRTMLLRLSGSMSSGERESEFFGREADVFGTSYGDQYERKLDTLKLWTDAFSALIISAVLVIIIGVVSTMIYKTDRIFTLGLVGLTIGISIGGTWLISLMSPKEQVPLQQPSSAEQKQIRLLMMALIPTSIVVALLLLASDAGMGWAMLIGGLILFPIGHVAVKDDKLIAKRDGEIGAFLRSLGGVTTAIGATVTEGICRMDLRAMPVLREGTTHLKKRLEIGIMPSICWKRFVVETGSVVVNRSVGMFRDAMALGAGAEDAGKRASAYAVKLDLLRARRRLITKPFGMLTFAMHGAVVLLLVFVTEVMMRFGSMIMNIEMDIPGSASSSAVGGYFSFNFAGLQLLTSLVMPVIIVLTVVNAMAPKLAEGGHKCKFFYNLSITMCMSGICLIIVPYLVTMVFGSVGG